MNLKTKIIIGIFLVYSIIISVLLLRSNELLRMEKTDGQDLQQVIDSLDRINIRKLDDIPEFKLKVDSLALVLERVERGILDLHIQKTAIENKYRGRIGDLDRIELDSLKKIALEL